MIRQQQKQKQTLKLTPQQILLMKLIQMPVSDLSQHIKEEIVKNPLLEEAPASTIELPTATIDDNEDWDDEDYRYRERLECGKNNQQHERLYTSEQSTIERLLEQIDMKPLSNRQRLIARELVGNIDNNGYLSRDIMLIVNDIAFRQGIEITQEEAESVLHIIQHCDPVGIGARNLQECLSIQLHNIDLHNSAQVDAIKVIDNNFDLFGRHQYERIQERNGWDSLRLDAAIQLIQQLDPKPGADNNSENTAYYVVPDFYVSTHDGELTIIANDACLPTLQTNQYYDDLNRQLSANPSQDANEKETLSFLRTKVEEAHTFIETLDQRKRTLGHIVNYIVRYQSLYFLSGDPCDLLPLQQKDVAQATGYDTSTISRVVNNKHLQTDFGVVALKNCFTKAVETDSGDTIGIEHIKSTLRNLVDHEDKTHPLTDDALTTAMQRKGIAIARRTVAKYRELLGIPVGRLRRKLLALVLLIACFSSLHLSAQVDSYYDSLINAQLHPRQGSSTSQPTRFNDNVPYTKQKSQLRPIPKPVPPTTSAVETNAHTPVGALWYGNYFSSIRVKERVLTLDSLPDEINIRLVKQDSDFCFPVKNIITSPYGWRWERAHRGVDIRLNVGTPVHCIFAGVVRIACPMGAYGNLVVVRHYNGLETAYAHLSKIQVNPHQIVQAGDVVGLGGSTGRSTGPHLHFEVRFMYESFDPEWILDFSNYTLRTKRLHLDKSYFGVTKPKRGESITYKADKSYVKEETQPISKGKRYYTAKSEDDLQLIAIKCHTTVAKLKELNPDIKKITPGIKLRVK